MGRYPLLSLCLPFHQFPSCLLSHLPDTFSLALQDLVTLKRISFHFLQLFDRTTNYKTLTDYMLLFGPCVQEQEKVDLILAVMKCPAAHPLGPDAQLFVHIHKVNLFLSHFGVADTSIKDRVKFLV